MWKFCGNAQCIARNFPRAHFCTRELCEISVFYIMQVLLFDVSGRQEMFEYTGKTSPSNYQDYKNTVTH